MLYCCNSVLPSSASSSLCSSAPALSRGGEEEVSASTSATAAFLSSPSVATGDPPTHGIAFPVEDSEALFNSQLFLQSIERAIGGTTSSGDEEEDDEDCEIEAELHHPDQLFYESPDSRHYRRHRHDDLYLPSSLQGDGCAFEEGERSFAERLYGNVHKEGEGGVAVAAETMFRGEAVMELGFDSCQSYATASEFSSKVAVHDEMCCSDPVLLGASDFDEDEYLIDSATLTVSTLSPEVQGEADAVTAGRDPLASVTNIGGKVFSDVTSRGCSRSDDIWNGEDVSAAQSGLLMTDIPLPCLRLKGGLKKGADELAAESNAVADTTMTPETGDGSKAAEESSNVCLVEVGPVELPIAEGGLQNPAGLDKAETGVADVEVRQSQQDQALLDNGSDELVEAGSRCQSERAAPEALEGSSTDCNSALSETVKSDSSVSASPVLTSDILESSERLIDKGGEIVSTRDGVRMEEVPDMTGSVLEAKPGLRALAVKYNLLEKIKYDVTIDYRHEAWLLRLSNGILQEQIRKLEADKSQLQPSLPSDVETAAGQLCASGSSNLPGGAADLEKITPETIISKPTASDSALFNVIPKEVANSEISSSQPVWSLAESAAAGDPLENPTSQSDYIESAASPDTFDCTLRPTELSPADLPVSMAVQEGISLDEIAAPTAAIQADAGSDVNRSLEGNSLVSPMDKEERNVREALSPDQDSNDSSGGVPFSKAEFCTYGFSVETQDSNELPSPKRRCRATSLSFASPISICPSGDISPKNHAGLPMSLMQSSYPLAEISQSSIPASRVPIKTDLSGDESEAAILIQASNITSASHVVKSGPESDHASYLSDHLAGGPAEVKSVSPVESSAREREPQTECELERRLAEAPGSICQLAPSNSHPSSLKPKAEVKRMLFAKLGPPPPSSALTPLPTLGELLMTHQNPTSTIDYLQLHHYNDSSFNIDHVLPGSLVGCDPSIFGSDSLPTGLTGYPTGAMAGLSGAFSPQGVAGGALSNAYFPAGNYPSWLDNSSNIALSNLAAAAAMGNLASTRQSFSNASIMGTWPTLADFTQPEATGYPPNTLGGSNNFLDNNSSTLWPESNTFNSDSKSSSHINTPRRVGPAAFRRSRALWQPPSGNTTPAMLALQNATSGHFHSSPPPPSDTQQLTVNKHRLPDYSELPIAGLGQTLFDVHNSYRFPHHSRISTANANANSNHLVSPCCSNTATKRSNPTSDSGAAAVGTTDSSASAVLGTSPGQLMPPRIGGESVQPRNLRVSDLLVSSSRPCSDSSPQGFPSRLSDLLDNAPTSPAPTISSMLALSNFTALPLPPGSSYRTSHVRNSGHGIDLSQFNDSLGSSRNNNNNNSSQIDEVILPTAKMSKRDNSTGNNEADAITKLESSHHPSIFFSDDAFCIESKLQGEANNNGLKGDGTTPFVNFSSNFSLEKTPLSICSFAMNAGVDDFQQNNCSAETAIASSPSSDSPTWCSGSNFIDPSRAEHASSSDKSLPHTNRISSSTSLAGALRSGGHLSHQNTLAILPRASLDSFINSSNSNDNNEVIQNITTGSNTNNLLTLHFENDIGINPSFNNNTDSDLVINPNSSVTLQQQQDSSRQSVKHRVSSLSSQLQQRISPSGTTPLSSAVNAQNISTTMTPCHISINNNPSPNDDDTINITPSHVRHHNRGHSKARSSERRRRRRERHMAALMMMQGSNSYPNIKNDGNAVTTTTINNCFSGTGDCSGSSRYDDLSSAASVDYSQSGPQNLFSTAAEQQQIFQSNVYNNNIICGQQQTLLGGAFDNSNNNRLARHQHRARSHENGGSKRGGVDGASALKRRHKDPSRKRRRERHQPTAATFGLSNTTTTAMAVGGGSGLIDIVEILSSEDESAGKSCADSQIRFPSVREEGAGNGLTSYCGMGDGAGPFVSWPALSM